MSLIKEQEFLGGRTFWRAGGRADFFCRPENGAELQEALSWAEKRGLPVTALGRGTNVLISDQGVGGLVIASEGLDRCSVSVVSDKKGEEKVLRIEAEAGVLKSRLAIIFRRYRLSPALFLSGLPGDVGGGLVMNAGIGGDEVSPQTFSEIVRDFEIMTSQGARRVAARDIPWGYRRGASEQGFIYRARLEWPLRPVIPDLNQKIKKILRKRRETQPLSVPTCGSVFKNPLPQYAGRLIEAAGLKGARRGGAFISEKHANFIVNEGGAGLQAPFAGASAARASAAEDIAALIRLAQKTVWEKFGVRLETEVRFLGRWPAKPLP